ncbi:hypothetical protein OG994_26325 [Micromonospora globbae]|uniref:AbiTii domain-containing protein n=1 Tax=Micromonospora globbae TaxID=1894969 RepID=A0ABZ1S528_9ACTN|nr:hypothetical protein [Micromonospora globbae]
MTDTLLRSLREHLLDESEPLAGLLRKCLLLGAETGSEALRERARRELNGYGDEDEVPKYRKFHDVPISMDSMSGRTWRRGDIISRLNLPPEAREYVPEEFTFKQPIEELQHLAGQIKLSFTSPGLVVAQAIWNRKLGPFQSVDGLSYVMTGSAVMGILGQIRTKLGGRSRGPHRRHADVGTTQERPGRRRSEPPSRGHLQHDDPDNQRACRYRCRGKGQH